MNPPPDALVPCLGWTLVHFLWQGICIAAWLKVCLWLLRRSSANQRYLAGCVALAAMAIAPIITFNHFTQQQAALAPVTPLTMPLTNPGAREISAIPSEPESIVSIRHEPHSKIAGRRFYGALPWLVTAWAAGVTALSVRLLVGWWHVERLKGRATASLGGYWYERLAELASRLRMSRTIYLVQSTLVEVPTVIGWLRPMILLPAGCVLGLNPAQLEAVLAHELAHIRRHDFFVNLLQNALETLLFYHPAVWWVSRCVRQERENCCDDLALSVCEDRMTYARALAMLEELRPGPAQFALAASGAPLLERIRRLAGRPDKEVGRSGWLAVAIFTTTIAVVVTLSFRENRAVAREQNQPANSTTNASNPILAEWRTATLLSEAERLFDAGDLDGAESKFKQVPADDPKAPRAAVFLEKIKQAREAKSFYSLDRIATQVNGKTQTLVRTDTNESVLQTGRVNIDKAGQNILSKLAGIRIDKVEYENWPLEDVLNDLKERSGSLDPDRTGINFLINRGLEPPRGEGTEVVDISREITVTIKPALSNICLADVLDVITNVANKPTDVPGILRYSIGDFAVIFSLSTNESAQTLMADPTVAERDFIEATREELIGPNSPSRSGASPSPGLAALLATTSDEYNRVLEYGRSLGERRAIQARLAWLRAGIDPSRVNVLSTNPVNPGKKESVTIGNSVITADRIELNTNAGTITATGSARIVTSQVTKTNPVIRAEFSPDGKRIVTAASDGAHRVWDVQTGKALGTISSNSAVSGLKTTASNEPTRIWDARTGKVVDFASVTGALTNDSKEGRLYAPEMKSSASPTNSISGSNAETNAAHYNSLKIDKDSQRIQEAALLKMLNEIQSTNVTLLRQSLPAGAPDPVLTQLLQDYIATEEKLVSQLNDPGPNHPDVQRTIMLRDQLNQKIGERISATINFMEAESTPPMATRIFHIDPNTFKEGLSSAASTSNRHGSESSSDQFVQVVATTNDAFLLCAHIESVLVTNGIDLDPANPLNAGKSFIFNDRKGTFFVHSTATEIDRVETIIQALNTSPPEIRIKAVGASTNDSKGGRLVAPEMTASDSPTNSIRASTLDTSATGTRTPMVTRVFRIDPNCFKEGLRSAASVLAREGKPSNSDASQLARVVTTTNDASLLRAVLVANGVDLNSANPLNAGKTLFYNERKGTVMVHSTAADLNRVASVLQTLNTSPPQIQIKAVFVEVDDVSNQFAGLSIFVKSGRFETSLTNQPVSDLERFFQNREYPITNSILMQYTGTMTRAQAAEFMHKLEQQNGVDILTTPVVITKSGRQEQIQVSDVQSIVTGVNPGGSGTNQFIVQSLPFGPTLDVIPRVSEDGRNIQMVVIPTVTEFIGYDNPGKFIANTNGTVRGGKDASLSAVLPLPHFRLRQLVANVSVEDGETIVLEGVAAESTTQLKDKIPVLGDIPGLGHLFRSSSTVKTRKNLLVFVTPRLVNPDGTPFHPGKATGEK
jgi:type II secretory pathway component GspD/PulD (secretin)/beta-lactamase regulating signal transducer with metallopeptidase domain